MASHLIHSKVQGHNTRPGGLYDLHPPLATHRTPSALPVIFPVAQAMVIPLTFWESLKHSTHAPAPGSLHLLLPFACSAFPWVFVYLHARSLSLSGFCSNVSETTFYPSLPPPCLNFIAGTSLAVQCVRIHLPMQGDVGSIPGPEKFHMLQSN